MSDCQFELIGTTTDEWFVHRCKVCRMKHTSRHMDSTMLHRNCDSLQKAPLSPDERSSLLPKCKHLGEATEDVHACGGCGGGYRTLFECELHERCLPLLYGHRATSIANDEENPVAVCSVCQDAVESVS